MEMIQRILNTEEANYASNLSLENLKQKMEDLFAQNSLGFVGKLINENEFAAYDNLVVIGWSMPHIKRKSAYLNGKITRGESGSLINLKVNPNSILPLFAVLATLTGLIMTLVSLSSAEAEKFLLMTGLGFLALGIAYYPLSTLLRNRLRNKIVKHLDLSQV